MLRLLATARWLGWTLLAATAVVVCAGMSWWQLGRAESPTGSLLNAGYAFQWPLFGLFFAALWWRMLRAEARELAEIRAGAASAGGEPGRDLVAVGPDGAVRSSPFTPRPRGTAVGDGQGAPAPGSARAEYNAFLAELARHSAGDPGPDVPAPELPERRA